MMNASEKKEMIDHEIAQMAFDMLTTSDRIKLLNGDREDVIMMNLQQRSYFNGLLENWYQDNPGIWHRRR